MRGDRSAGPATGTEEADRHVVRGVVRLGEHALEQHVGLLAGFERRDELLQAPARPIIPSPFFASTMPSV